MRKNTTILIALALLLTVIGIFRLTRSSRTARIIEKVENTVTSYIPTPTTSLNPQGVPSRYLIDNIAFVPQAPAKNWDQPWQDACEEASLLTVTNYYRDDSNSTPDKLTSQLNSIFTIESNLGYGHDVDLSQLLQVSNQLSDYQGTIIDNPSMEDIKQYISQNIPVIVVANGKTLYSENKYFKNGGPWYHSLVIIGYDDSLQKFIVHDVGTQFGSHFKYSYPVLMSAIHDFPETKNKEDIDQGVPRILILVK